MVTQYDKAIVALIAGGILNYFTPDVTHQLVSVAGDYASQLVAAVITGAVGAVVVWATKNKPQ